MDHTSATPPQSATTSHGGVTVTFDAALQLDPRAGNLSDEEVLRLAKAPRGLGLVSELTAASMESAGPLFVPPAGIDPATLRRLGARAEAYDTVLAALEVVRKRLAQGNLLADAEAWEALRKVNDMVNSQAKHEPQLATMFAPVREFMRRGKTGAKVPEPTPA